MTDSRGQVAVGIIGANGRLGRAVEAACVSNDIEVVGRGGRDSWRASGVPGVIFDASRRDAIASTIRLCHEHSAALVTAVSDYDASDERLLDAVARDLAVVRVTNLSKGSWLQLQLVRELLRLVGAQGGYEVAVSERHAVTKRDTPSATARRLARAWTASNPRVDFQRQGPQVADHALRLAAPGEELTIAHSVTDLRPAGTGAAQAISWAASAPAGTWSEDDVFREHTQEGRS